MNTPTFNKTMFQDSTISPTNLKGNQAKVLGHIGEQFQGIIAALEGNVEHNAPVGSVSPLQFAYMDLFRAYQAVQSVIATGWTGAGKTY